MTTWLIHGFNVRDGGHGSIGRLRGFLPGAVRLYSYGWTGLLGLKCANERAITSLQQRVKPGDTIVAHSNGCLIAWGLAQRMGTDLAAVVCINPALRRDTVWPAGLPVLCLANSTDWVVQFGRVWGRLVPFDGVQAQGWGAAGRYGFTVPSDTVHTWDTAETYWRQPVRGHSGVFDTGAVTYWGGLIAAWLRGQQAARMVGRRCRGVLPASSSTRT